MNVLSFKRCPLDIIRQNSFLVKSGLEVEFRIDFCTKSVTHFVRTRCKSITVSRYQVKVSVVEDGFEPAFLFNVEHGRSKRRLADCYFSFDKKTRDVISYVASNSAGES